MELTREDWAEIYYALDSKRVLVVQGGYGHQSAWAGHLADIMEKIGPDGRNMTEGE